MKRLCRLSATIASALLLLGAAAPGSQATETREPTKHCDPDGKYRACLYFGWKDRDFDSVEAVLLHQAEGAEAAIWADVKGKRVVLCEKQDTKKAKLSQPPPWIDPEEVSGRKLNCPWHKAFDKVRVGDMVHARFWASDGKVIGSVDHELTSRN